jgi:hypothetical protein
MGDYSDPGDEHYSPSKSARGMRREPVPAPNLGERNKSVGSTVERNQKPYGQIAQPRSRDGSSIRLDDPGDLTNDQTRALVGRTSDNSGHMHTYTNAT